MKIEVTIRGSVITNLINGTEVKDFWTILKDYSEIRQQGFLIKSVRIVQDFLTDAIYGIYRWP